MARAVPCMLSVCHSMCGWPRQARSRQWMKKAASQTSDYYTSDRVMAMMANFHGRMLNKLATKCGAPTTTLNESLTLLKHHNVFLDKKVVSRLRKLDNVFKVMRHVTDQLLERTLQDIDAIDNVKLIQPAPPMDLCGYNKQVADRIANLESQIHELRMVATGCGFSSLAGGDSSGGASAGGLSDIALAPSQAEHFDISSEVGDVECDKIFVEAENDGMNISPPNILIDRNFADERASVCSALLPTIGCSQGKGDIEYGKIYVDPGGQPVAGPMPPDVLVDGVDGDRGAFLDARPTSLDEGSAVAVDKGAVFSDVQLASLDALMSELSTRSADRFETQLKDLSEFMESSLNMLTASLAVPLPAVHIIDGTIMHCYEPDALSDGG